MQGKIKRISRQSKTINMINTILLSRILLVLLIIMCQQYYHHLYRKMMDDVIEGRLRDIAKGQNNIWMQAISNNLPEFHEEIRKADCGKEIKIK